MNYIKHGSVQSSSSNWVVPVFEMPLRCDIRANLEAAQGDVKLLDLFIALEGMRIGL